MIRMLLEDMLAELGCTIAAEATHIKDALEAVRNAGSMLPFWTSISAASPYLRSQMPSPRAAPHSSSPRAMASGHCPIPSRATNVEEAVSARTPQAYARDGAGGDAAVGWAKARLSNIPCVRKSVWLEFSEGARLCPPYESIQLPSPGAPVPAPGRTILPIAS
jgi:hypothetical protein